VLPVAQRHGMGVMTWSPLAWGLLTGRHRKGRTPDLTVGRAKIAPDRFDAADPAYQAKLDVVEQLAVLADDLGVSLPELAVAFPAAHPAVTSVIIGPRTPEQLEGLLKGASLVLDDATLDRIDAIVSPGTDVYRADSAWQPAAVREAALRRRPAGERAAA
jgi:aryl-alcohol dehydrogenase-like predicted oxidoreductase